MPEHGTTDQKVLVVGPPPKLLRKAMTEASARFQNMNTTDLLIAATVAGPVLATLVSPGLAGAVLKLARARARRVKHIEVSGIDLYHSGVPMTETQFREAFAAYQGALDELPPPAERGSGT